jgi:hypothetical protein
MAKSSLASRRPSPTVVQRQYDVFQRALLAAQRLCPLGVVPDLRILEF